MSVSKQKIPLSHCALKIRLFNPLVFNDLNRITSQVNTVTAGFDSSRFASPLA